MKRILPLLIVVCAGLSVSTFAAQITSNPVLHPGEVYQAYPGYSEGSLLQKGIAGLGASVHAASPGILGIDRGDPKWMNFVAAARDHVSYGIKNVSLTKSFPPHIQCRYDQSGTPVFPSRSITQQGTNNIRLWWPLMYEVPGTTFTLSILYGTPSLYDDDGPLPNPKAWAHMDKWTWVVNLDIDHFEYLIRLFHELPFGKSEVPLINDEELYEWLLAKIKEVKETANTSTAIEILGQIDLELADYVLGTMPTYPNRTGNGMGVANTNENPAACVILVDLEYLIMNGIGYTAR